jgi:uncharacterized protein (DUF1697 family)
MMQRWIILLRAVNVGGTAKVPMEELRNALAAAGYGNVRSYIASGNLFVDTEQDDALVKQSVDGILNTQFSISGSRSILREGVDIHRIVKANPFRDVAQNRPEFLHVHFLASQPQANAEMNLTSYKGAERLRLDGQNLYINYVNGAGQSALTPRFLETALGTAGTARNWNTVLKLAEMTGEA